MGFEFAQNNGGAIFIATSESRTNVAYGTLTTPDQVTVVLPTNGLIAVWYEATWQQSVANAAKAAIFIGANQLQSNQGAAGPTVQEVGIGGIAASNAPLATSSQGVASSIGIGYTGDVTTGQIISCGGAGGPCYIFAAAGTYTISVQFKATSGSVTASNRRLKVRVM